MNSESKKGKFKIENLMTFVRGYFMPTFSIIVLVLVLALVTIPTVRKIQDNLSTIDSKKRELTQLNSFVSELTQIINSEETFVADNLIIDRYLPQQSRVSLFIDNLNALAINSGLDSSELSGTETIQQDDDLVGDEEEIDKPARVLVTFNFSGDFDEVYQLFEEINNYKQLLSVQSVSFSKGREDWSVDIIVASYNLPQETLDYVVENAVNANRGKRLEYIDELVLDQIKKKV